jgi:VWFA-related protein
MRHFIAALLLCGCAFAQAPEPGYTNELSVAFVNKPGQYRTDIAKEDVRVTEDGVPQRVVSLEPVSAQPRCIALLVDSSGSNRAQFDKDGPKRLLAAANAALDWVRQTFPGPGNQAMVVNFNIEAYLDQKLTGSVPEIAAAMQKLDMRAGTAFYDALISTALTLDRDAAPGCRRIIVAITDAIDNSSKAQQGAAAGAVRRAHATLYLVGLRDRDQFDVTRRIVESTGGLYFSPSKMKDPRAAFAAIEQDLNARYRLAYRSLSAHDRRVDVRVGLWDSSRKKLGKVRPLAPLAREVAAVPGESALR